MATKFFILYLEYLFILIIVLLLVFLRCVCEIAELLYCTVVIN